MADKIWQVLSNEISTTVAEAGRSVVAVHGRRHPSSGVLMSSDSVVTVNHGLRREEDITVVFESGERVAGRVAGRDPSTDLAVLRIEKERKTTAPRWGDATSLRLGELVLALGRTWRGNVVASSGIVSGLIPGPWRTWRGGELEQFIRPGLTLYPGFSGGPLVSSAGEFLGINTAGLHRSGITIPAATVTRVAAELLEKGRIERPYLGLAMQPVVLPESLRNQLNLTSTEGLLAVHLEPGAPAEKAGAMLGDILIELAGKPVADTDAVQEALRASAVGGEVEAVVIRGGATARLKVKLEARPAR
ncbi:MAG TPA: trypsin-like peptidase domain-containing protein [Candidatus Angelobacter sp.]|nr:trypsin-like peptidase domain-containing protein [Candidatus Angelobacter sp.]